MIGSLCVISISKTAWRYTLSDPTESITAANSIARTMWLPAPIWCFAYGTSIVAANRLRRKSHLSPPLMMASETTAQPRQLWQAEVQPQPPRLKGPRYAHCRRPRGTDFRRDSARAGHCQLLG